MYQGITFKLGLLLLHKNLSPHVVVKSRFKALNLDNCIQCVYKTENCIAKYECWLTTGHSLNRDFTVLYDIVLPPIFLACGELLHYTWSP